MQPVFLVDIPGRLVLSNCVQLTFLQLEGISADWILPNSSLPNVFVSFVLINESVNRFCHHNSVSI